jgi:hypothetical protein
VADQNLSCAVEETLQRLADLAGLDDLGRTPAEAQADEAAEALAFGVADEPAEAVCQPAGTEIVDPGASQGPCRASLGDVP